MKIEFQLSHNLCSCVRNRAIYQEIQIHVNKIVLRSILLDQQVNTNKVRCIRDILSTFERVTRGRVEVPILISKKCHQHKMSLICCH